MCLTESHNSHNTKGEIHWADIKDGNELERDRGIYLEKVRDPLSANSCYPSTRAEF